jgi:hypothetical protein
MEKCNICEQSFETYRQLNGHKRLHGQSNGGYSVKRRNKATKDLSLCVCLGCQSVFKPDKSIRRYCSIGCQQKLIEEQKLLDVERGKKSTLRIIKKFLIRKHGNKCMDPECAWDNDRRPIAVELDHIDGDSINNALDNFRLLCPCCHSLTPTYKGKNRGNGRTRRMELYREKKLACSHPELN